METMIAVVKHISLVNPHLNATLEFPGTIDLDIPGDTRDGVLTMTCGTANAQWCCDVYVNGVIVDTIETDVISTSTNVELIAFALMQVVDGIVGKGN